MSSRMGVMKNVCTVLVKKSERKTPLERSRHRWKDNIRIDLTEVVWDSVD